MVRKNTNKRARKTRARTASKQSIKRQSRKTQKGGNTMRDAPDAPKAPMKKNPYVSRLSEKEYKKMQDYEDYDAEPIDLDALGEIPIGDDIPEGYGEIKKKRGLIAGMKRRTRKARVHRRMK